MHKCSVYVYVTGITSVNCIGQVSHVETTLSWGTLRGEESHWDLDSYITYRGEFRAHTGVYLCF